MTALEAAGAGRGLVDPGIPLPPLRTGKVGTLVVDLFDSHNKKLIWRGSSSDALSNKSNNNIKILIRCVQKMFDHFPPVREAWQTTRDKHAVRRQPALATPGELGSEAVKNLGGALNALLADVFALYMKTKNFHWHMSGPHFRDYHLLLDEQGGQIFAMTDDIAERVRKLGGGTVRSIGHIRRLQRLSDNDAEYVDPLDMIAELREDNRAMLTSMREAHDLCDEENDVATASLLETWIDETERRIWFLFEIGRARLWA